MYELKPRFFLMVGLSIALAAGAILLTTPHTQVGHVHSLGGVRHSTAAQMPDGTHVHHTYEAPTDDLTSIRETLRMREVPHLTFPRK